MASTLDIAPTLLEMVDVEEPEAMQGMSMAAVIRGEEENHRTAAMIENDDGFIPAKIRTLTTDDWKLTWYAFSNKGELYDRKKDPDNTKNLWDDPAFEVVRRELKDMLMEEMVAALDATNRRTQNARPEPVKWIPTHNRPKS
jgi:arylsulfatase A-like enzyme